MKKKDEMINFLGRGTEFEGKLAFRGIMRIDGHYIGEISAGGNLIIGEEGMIEANVHASSIIISGEVHGNVIADQRVDIHPPGKVFGDIQAPAVVIDEGVIFEGKTQMYQAKKVGDRELGAPMPDESASEQSASLCAVYGVVSDQNTNEPIKNAELRCVGMGQKSTITNASGYYELINLEAGNWKFIIKARGYKKAKVMVEISGEETIEKDLELKPKKNK